MIVFQKIKQIQNQMQQTRSAITKEEGVQGLIVKATPNPPLITSPCLQKAIVINPSM